MPTDCINCGKPLEVKRYRQCTTYCCIKCARQFKHNLNRKRIEFMRQLREDNKAKPTE